MVKLAEDGVITLDDPIRKYIPDFAYADGSITIQQLLNHTSGLFMMVKHPDSPFRKPYHEIDHEHWWTVEEIFTELGGDPYFTPGEGWCYSQAGYQLATLIVEAVTGETVGEAVWIQLLDPLDITGIQLMANPIPDGVEIAHPWVDVDGDGEYEDVHADSRNWIASLSRILFYANPSDFAAWGHALFSGGVLSQESMTQLLDFYHMQDRCGEPPFFNGYGLGVQEFDPGIFAGQEAWGHLGSIQGYRSLLAHLPESGVTMAIMTNTDSDGAMVVVDKLLEVLYEHLDGMKGEVGVIDLNPVRTPPEGVPVFDTFQREALFCEHNSSWELEASTEEWINISLEWVVGSDPEKAIDVWGNHQHTIEVNGIEIPNLEDYTHDVIQYNVHCPDETLQIWAKGLSIYLPPLPKGDYQVRWFSRITGGFDNGWVAYEPGNSMEFTAEIQIKDD